MKDTKEFNRQGDKGDKGPSRSNTPRPGQEFTGTSHRLLGNTSSPGERAFVNAGLMVGGQLAESLKRRRPSDEGGTEVKKPKLDQAERATYETTYLDFKKSQEENQIKDVKSLVETLTHNYTPEDRSGMIKEHLKDVYKGQADINADHEQFIALQKAFVIVRGEDSYKRLQQEQPLSVDQIKAIIESHDKRYMIAYEEDDDYDENIGPRVCTAVKGERQPCYTNLIELKEETGTDGSTVLHGSVSFLGNYKTRPKETRPETQIYNSEDESEINDVYDDDTEIIGTKPLFQSHIIYNQIRFRVENKGSDMSQFRLSSMSSHDVINQETVRTMNLFVKPETSKTFKQGEDGYYAALGTSIGKRATYLLAEYFPGSGISQIEVDIKSSEKIKFIGFTLA